MNLLIKPLTGLLGLVLTLVGIAGFFHDGMLFLFEVDTVHNIVHLFTGLIALFCYNSSQAYSRIFLILFGFIYGVVALLGYFMNGDILGLFHVNMADNQLHLGLATVSLIVGLGSRK